MRSDVVHWVGKEVTEGWVGKEKKRFMCQGYDLLNLKMKNKSDKGLIMSNFFFVMVFYAIYTFFPNVFLHFLFFFFFLFEITA